MISRLAVTPAPLVIMALLMAPWMTTAQSQTFTPQSAGGLSVSYQVERIGGSRLLVFGEVRNTTGAACERVVVLVQGLDDSGKVVSRGRGYVHGIIPPKGSSSFEVRLLASGSEKRYRVEVESFQFISN